MYNPKLYDIVRHYRDSETGEHWKRYVKTGVPEYVAKEHCNDDSTRGEYEEQGNIIKWFDNYVCE